MKALVTGGGGFLGSTIARMLHERGDDVLVLGRRPYPHHERAGIGTMQADIRDATALRTAFQGMDTVFHVAAKVGIWGARKKYWEVNVDGTRNVINACRRNGVLRLVFTSSPSVVFSDSDLNGVDESHPYPDKYLADYPETKAIAERLVLSANGDALATVALRPHLIWGPGDPHLVPKLVERARAGRLIQVGDGKNRVDITYIDNAAQAHLQAADHLDAGSACCGNAYFISQGEPVVLWAWINEVLGSAGASTVTRSVSFKTAYRAGALMERVYRAVGLESEPRMTRFLALQLAKSHFFSIGAARRDFGYDPSVSTEVGLARMFDWLGSQELGQSRDNSGASTRSGAD